MSYWGFPKYVSVEERRARAAKKIKKLRKKRPDLKPIIIEGRAIAKTWWGKQWNKNLERYADYENRIGRGRSYVRHMAVLDLQISPGRVEALVLGSRSSPYSVMIEIKPLPDKSWRSIKNECKGRLNSLQKLMRGQFPKALDEIFTAKGKGLFPSPDEIEFSCSCPDWAYMCKHVAAALYGIGARLDEDPGLFFVLRKVKVDDLISEAVNDSAAQLLKKAGKKSSRVIDDSNLSDVFGIDLGEENDDVKIRVKTPLKKKNTTKKGRKKSRPGKSALRAIDVVEKLIRKNKNGTRVAELKERTDFDEIKIRNIVFRLKKQGRIKNKSRGVYVGRGR